MDTGSPPSPSGLCRAELVFLGACRSVGFTFLTLFTILLPAVGFLAVEVLIDLQGNNCPEQRKQLNAALMLLIHILPREAVPV